MTDADRFWTRVQELLDERRDPLDDPLIRTHLADHPEQLETFANLTDALAALAPPATGGRRRRWLAAAAGVALAAGSFYAIGGVGWLAPAAPTIELPEIAEQGRVMRFSSRYFTNGPGGQVSLEVETGALAVVERAVRTVVQPRAATPHGHPIRTQWTRQRSQLRAGKVTE